MPRSRPIRMLAVLALLALAVSGFWAARASALHATPVAEGTDASLVLMEHADRVTEVDLGETGSSIGDMIVWGPNALYDATNATDTGAVT